MSSIHYSSEYWSMNMLTSEQRSDKLFFKNWFWVRTVTATYLCPPSAKPGLRRSKRRQCNKIESWGKRASEDLSGNIYIYMYLCMYVCMYVYIYIYDIIPNHSTKRFRSPLLQAFPALDSRGFGHQPAHSRCNLHVKKVGKE